MSILWWGLIIAVAVCIVIYLQHREHQRALEVRRKGIFDKYGEELRKMQGVYLLPGGGAGGRPWQVGFSAEGKKPADQIKVLRVIEARLRALKKELNIDIRNARQQVGSSNSAEVKAKRAEALAPYVAVQDEIDRVLLELDAQKAELRVEQVT